MKLIKGQLYTVRDIQDETTTIRAIIEIKEDNSKGAKFNYTIEYRERFDLSINKDWRYIIHDADYSSTVLKPISNTAYNALYRSNTP